MFLDCVSCDCIPLIVCLFQEYLGEVDIYDETGGSTGVVAALLKQ